MAGACLVLRVGRSSILNTSVYGATYDEESRMISDRRTQ
jgi:hypothetical protein